MASFSVPDSELRHEIYNPANFSASESSFDLENHMKVEKLDGLNENIKILYLFIHYIYFIVMDNPHIKSRYELLFESHQTKSTLYLKLQEIANKMSKMTGVKSFMKTIFQEAHEKRLSDEPYPVIAMFIKYYHDNYHLFKEITDISVLDTIINEVKEKSYLWLTKVGRSTHPSYTPEIHSLYNSKQNPRYAPPPPRMPPPIGIRLANSIGLGETYANIRARAATVKSTLGIAGKKTRGKKKKSKDKKSKDKKKKQKKTTQKKPPTKKD